MRNYDVEVINLLQDRINAAVKIASECGMHDGGHHKQWVIDQMLQKLLRPDQYEYWLEGMNSDPEYAPWDPGIPP
jgi:hypothetical protein